MSYGLNKLLLKQGIKGDDMKITYKLEFIILTSLCLSIGCASTKVTDRQVLVNEKLHRPDHILVYDFVATPADVPTDSSLAGRQDEHPTSQTDEEITAARAASCDRKADFVSCMRASPRSHIERTTRKRRERTSFPRTPIM